MPFTPYHFGPGLLVKGIAARWYSWTAFVATQIVIDCETLYYLSRREYPLHRTLHTFVGATIVGVATAVTLMAAKWLAQRTAPGFVDSLRSRRASIRAESSTIGLLVGGLVGGLTHPLLDGLMHRDIRPFLPWSDSNPLLGVIGIEALHTGCEVAGLVGLPLVGIWLYFESRAD
ncbi:MAG TPA: hypothetical protein DC047_09130 [Blastocatellia bacterium]|nr:hypothetical protein [Blastocatellia bacterium]